MQLMLCFELQFLDTGMITITFLHFNVQVFYFNKRRTNNMLNSGQMVAVLLQKNYFFAKGGKGK